MGKRVKNWYVLIPITLVIALMPFETSSAELAKERKEMLRAIEASVRNSAEYTGRSELSPRVMRAMGTVLREEFVLPAYRHRAYHNTPLPIAAGQTISQPLIVALMTDLLAPQPDDIILEVGTGSGYQAAVLAQLVKHVYSIEIIPELASSAAEILAKRGYNNVTVRAGDGYAGWPEHAPFDGIVVTAAPEEIPPPLLKQLARGRQASDTGGSGKRLSGNTAGRGGRGRPDQ